LFSRLDIKIVLEYLKSNDYERVKEIEDFLESEGVVEKLEI
jgi:hypothetical protein